MGRLHHIALGANDVATVARFYGEQLGLAELKRFAYDDGSLRSIWLDLGGAILMVEHTEDSPHRIDGVGAGPFLIALSASPGERVRLEQNLERAGHPIEDRTAYTVYFRDPEGNRVALSSYQEVAGG